MNTRWLKYLLFILTVAMAFTACKEEEFIDPEYIGEGMAKITVSVDYEPDKAALDGSTRAAGNAINSINKLSLVIYKPDGELYAIYNNLPFTNEGLIKDNKPTDYSGTAAEDATARVSFSFPEFIPFGRYCMYVVANLNEDITESMAADPETLKSYSVNWQFSDTYGDVSKNSEMFGYMTTTVTGEQTSAGFDAPVITVNRQNVSLHSWVKRLASKVTIAYDGTGLNQNVWVYIHNVSLRQIPLECKLGEDNTPTANQITGDDYVQGKPATSFSSGQYFYYTAKGDVTGTDQYPNEYQYANWMMVANGTPVKGAVDHTQTDPALYFYENMQGDFSNAPDKEKYNKEMKDPNGTDPDKAGSNVTPESGDWKDRVPCGTFIEVEAYYVSNPENDPIHKSEGPIKYRFMLGQDSKFNYDAIRNHHYKLTLGFRGWANQPDWHIEYYEEEPDIIATETYMPYLYNQSAKFPIRLNGNVTSLEMEIIENNWGPYEPGHTGTGDGNSASDVPDMVVGVDNFEQRTIQFRWNLPVYANMSGKEKSEPAPGSEPSSSNYLYGLHKTNYYHLKEEEDVDDPFDKSKPYYVTPIWVGFLRLMQPESLESSDLPMTIFALAGSGDPWRYDKKAPREGMKSYYFGNGGDSYWTNKTDLHKRTFSASDLNAGTYKAGTHNEYTVEDFTVDGKPSKAITVNLWTQPKTMMYISGFSGNNPYEAYNRKAVVRITAHFNYNGKDVVRVRDVPVIQARRLVNPKGVWRTSTNTKPFHFTLYDNQTAASSTFEPLESKGSWSAKVITGSGITISPENGSYSEGSGVAGKTESNVNFQINFPGGQHFAVIEIQYHGNSAKHLVMCRQGYHDPVQIVDGGAYWSSYSLYSVDDNVPFGTQEASNKYWNATLTKSPLALGTLYKKGNYNEGILISNIDTYGPREAPNQGNFDLTNKTSKPWLDIYGVARKSATYQGSPTSSKTTTTTIKGKDYNSANWKWAKFNAKDKDGNTGHYRLPSYDDFEALRINADLAVGVLYGDFATAPQSTTVEAYGYFDPTNSGTPEVEGRGMRGAFIYNSSNAHNIFFPIGTSGMGRRTMQGLKANVWKDWAGVMRYSAVTNDLTGEGNSLRPIPYNMPNAPGVIYWLAQENLDFPGYEINYFDLNFNPYDYAMSIGPYGDAVPIKLVKDGTGTPATAAPNSSSKSKASSKARSRK